MTTCLFFEKKPKRMEQMKPNGNDRSESESENNDELGDFGEFFLRDGLLFTENPVLGEIQLFLGRIFDPEDTYDEPCAIDDMTWLLSYRIPINDLMDILCEENVLLMIHIPSRNTVITAFPTLDEVENAAYLIDSNMPNDGYCTVTVFSDTLVSLLSNHVTIEELIQDHFEDNS